jgi:hypothetical protein
VRALEGQLISQLTVLFARNRHYSLGAAKWRENHDDDGHEGGGARAGSVIAYGFS